MASTFKSDMSSIEVVFGIRLRKTSAVVAQFVEKLNERKEQLTAADRSGGPDDDAEGDDGETDGGEGGASS